MVARLTDGGLAPLRQARHARGERVAGELRIGSVVTLGLGDVQHRGRRRRQAESRLCLPLGARSGSATGQRAPERTGTSLDEGQIARCPRHALSRGQEVVLEARREGADARGPGDPRLRSVRSSPGSSRRRGIQLTTLAGAGRSSGRSSRCASAAHAGPACPRSARRTSLSVARAIIANQLRRQDIAGPGGTGEASPTGAEVSRTTRCTGCSPCARCGPTARLRGSATGKGFTLVPPGPLQLLTSDRLGLPRDHERPGSP